MSHIHTLQSPFILCSLYVHIMYNIACAFIILNSSIFRMLQLCFNKLTYLLNLNITPKYVRHIAQALLHAFAFHAHTLRHRANILSS